MPCMLSVPTFVETPLSGTTDGISTEGPNVSPIEFLETIMNLVAPVGTLVNGKVNDCHMSDSSSEYALKEATSVT